MELPEIEKFMPMWACLGLILAFLAGFAAILIVLATSRRQRDDEKEQ